MEIQQAGIHDDATATQQRLNIFCLIKCPIYLKIGDKTDQSLFIFNSDNLKHAMNC
jgi:hypothetical protein